MWGTVGQVSDDDDDAREKEAAFFAIYIRHLRPIPRAGLPMYTRGLFEV